jgi:hypothetical protein
LFVSPTLRALARVAQNAGSHDRRRHHPEHSFDNVAGIVAIGHEQWNCTENTDAVGVVLKPKEVQDKMDNGRRPIATTTKAHHHK